MKRLKEYEIQELDHKEFRIRNKNTEVVVKDRENSDYVEICTSFTIFTGGTKSVEIPKNLLYKLIIILDEGVR